MNASKKGTRKGILLITLAALFFAFLAFFVRMAGDLPVLQKAFFRNFPALFIASGMLLRSEEKFRFERANLPAILARAILGTVGMLANFWAIDHMDLADATILNKTSPLFAMLISIILLKEIPRRIDWAMVAVAFFGVFLIVQPSAGLPVAAAAVALLGGLTAGTSYALVRMLGKRGERTAIIVFFFSAVSTLVCVPSLIFRHQTMTAGQLLCLIGAGCCGAGGQLSITAAYHAAPAKEIAVFDYFQVLFAAGIGFLFLGELPNLRSLIGYLLIIGAAVVRWYMAKKD